MTKSSLFQFLFSLKGRIPRYLFWRYVLLSYLSLIIYVLALGQANQLGILHGLLVIYLLYAYAIMLLIPFCIISVKRLHDMNQSGWWALLTTLLASNPYFGIIIFLILGIIKGTEGNNKYGPDPLNKDSSLGIKEDNTLTNNASPTNNTDIPPYIKSSFSPLDRARKK